MTDQENTNEEKQPRQRGQRKGKSRRRGSGSVFRRPERKGGKEWVAQIILEEGNTRQRYFKTQADADTALTEMLYEHKNQKLDEGQSPSSVITMHKVLHQALAHATRARLIAVNPCTGVALPTAKGRKVQALTVEQAQHLFREVQGTMMEPFIALALVLGMRHGELLALRWQDLDLVGGTLAIHFTLTQDEQYHFVVGDPKTASSERLLLLPHPVCEMLLAHRTRQEEARSKAGPGWQQHDLVFCTNKGAYLWPANVRQRFYRLLQRAGLPQMHIHDLRHSASTLLRKMGVDLKVIQEILGHSTLDMTANVYSHVLPSMQQEAVEKMKTLFGKPS